ncbi:ABC transporter ATP-binding protein [Aggregicoccus sp. 17bor-14]|nr:ABC transporter ATP-binding protein [Simulacricoccus sp. 17bor-14]MRI92314.1 ABC transporter ATP-binding protein [Aggregicoccus sp. 17bor-14]
MGVGKVYEGAGSRGGAAAVSDVSLDVAHGEFVCLVGPSGCGKSTTLNLVAGLERPSSGELRIDGERVNEQSPRERDVAMVFQSYALYPHRTVEGNLAFPLEVAGLPREEIRRRVGEAAERLGLTALLARRPKELSGGQRQRVALGRALVRRPRVFLFDEPLSNLDAALRTQVRGELKALHRSLGATFLYVTHDQAEAMTLADRVVVMSAGRVQQVAPPRELYAAPANTFVAGFFGSPRINLVRPGTLGQGPGAWTLGVRPEALEVGAGAAPPGGALAARVYLVEPLGAEAWVTVERTEGGHTERLTARAASDFDAPPGAPAWVRLRPGALLHRFDAATGARVDRAPDRAP